MRLVVVLAGVLITAVSLLGALVPERLVAFVASWPVDTRLRVAVVTRLLLGVVFLLAAPACRSPAIIRAVGVLAVAAAAVLVLLGGVRVDAMITWWSGQPRPFIRIWCVVGVLLGALVLSASRPRTRAS
jgi:hypothetical protein